MRIIKKTFLPHMMDYLPRQKGGIDIKLLHLKYLVEIADCRSLTRAANKLYISQPYLSRVVAEAETQLNKKLFIRSSSGLELTPWGHKVYLLAQSILHQMELLDNLSQNSEGIRRSAHLSVSTGNLFLGERLLLNYFSEVTAADIHFNLYETTIEECITNTEKGVSDFSLLVADDCQKKLLKNFLKKKKLEYQTLDEGEFCWHLHQDHPLAAHKLLSPDSLADYLFVRFRENPYSFLTCEAFRKEYPLFPADRCVTVNHYSSCLSLIRHSGAFMLGNKWQKSEFEREGIKSIHLTPLHQKAYLILIKSQLSALSKEAEDFLYLFRDYHNINQV